ncbi:integrase, catalytic region, zinc finger, CCHC-type containing protein [Tanacetum coccineum]
MKSDDQAIQIILMGLPEDIYAAVDSCETAQKIWLRVQQMMKGSDIRIQDKKAKLNKHFPKKTASNLKFLNNVQPEWRRHVTNVHQTKDLHEVDYTQLYDFLKYYQAENVGNQNGLIVVLRIANPNANQNGNGNVVAAWAEGNGNGNNGNQIRCYNFIGLGHLVRNCTVRPRKGDVAFLQTQLLIAQKEETGIQLQAEKFDFMAAAGDIEEVNANCILMANLQQALTSGTQTNNALVYGLDGSAEVVQISFESSWEPFALKMIMLLQFWVMFCDSDLEFAFRRNTCFVRNLEGVDLLKGNRTTNLYSVNLHEIVSASPICLMARATSTKLKDKEPEEIKIFLKKITFLLQAPVIIVRTENGTEFKNQVLQEYFNSVGISHQASSLFFWAEAIATVCYTQNRSIIHRRFNKTPYEIINVYNRRTKKIMKTMNMTFDELSAMAFEQSSSKPGLQGMTSGQISSGLDLTYAPSTITSQKLTEHELDLLFEAMYDDYISGQPSAATRTMSADQVPQVM